MFNSYVKLPEGMFGFYHGFLPSNIKGCSVSIFPTETKFQDLPSAEKPSESDKTNGKRWVLCHCWKDDLTSSGSVGNPT